MEIPAPVARKHSRLVRQVWDSCDSFLTVLEGGDGRHPAQTFRDAVWSSPTFRRVELHTFLLGDDLESPIVMTGLARPRSFSDFWGPEETFWSFPDPLPGVVLLRDQKIALEGHRFLVTLHGEREFFTGLRLMEPALDRRPAMDYTFAGRPVPIEEVLRRADYLDGLT